MDAPSDAHVVLAWTAEGYRLLERDGPPPAVGAIIEVDDGATAVVQKLGASPLPADPRPCAYVAPEPGAA